MTKQTFDDLINQINTVSNDVQRERGTLFEKLTLAYLKNEPTYKALYQNVWLLSEVPESYGIPKKDTGVDLVAEQKNGDLVAIQAKFYTNKVGKSEIKTSLWGSRSWIRWFWFNRCWHLWQFSINVYRFNMV